MENQNLVQAKNGETQKKRKRVWLVLAVMLISGCLISLLLMALLWVLLKDLPL